MSIKNDRGVVGVHHVSLQHADLLVSRWWRSLVVKAGTETRFCLRALHHRFHRYVARFYNRGRDRRFTIPSIVNGLFLILICQPTVGRAGYICGLKNSLLGLGHVACWESVLPVGSQISDSTVLDALVRCREASEGFRFCGWWSQQWDQTIKGEWWEWSLCGHRLRYVPSGRDRSTATN